MKCRMDCLNLWKQKCAKKNVIQKGNTIRPIEEICRLLLGGKGGRGQSANTDGVCGFNLLIWLAASFLHNPHLPHLRRNLCCIVHRRHGLARCVLYFWDDVLAGDIGQLIRAFGSFTILFIEIKNVCLPTPDAIIVEPYNVCSMS